MLKFSKTGIMGLRFGNWTVLDWGTKDKQGSVCWRCKCDCGTEAFVLYYNLVHGMSRSCGCFKRQRIGQIKIRPIEGQRFGKLVVIGREGSTTAGKARWLCRCDCGKNTIVTSGSLVSGNTKSCGCILKEWYYTLHTSSFYSSKVGTEFLNTLEKEFGVVIDREFHLESRYFDGRIGKILIEIDGSYWHSTKQQLIVDLEKDSIALRNGFVIVRLNVERVKDVPKRFQEYRPSFAKLFSLKGYCNAM